MKRVIETPRLILREIDPSVDDLHSYLGWLRDIQNNAYIESARVDYEMETLKLFINTANIDPNVMLLGIFLKDKKHFIGTLKIQPLNRIEKFAWVGMMIGSPKFRGLGYGKESLESVLFYLFDSLQINDIYLGVNLENSVAISLYSELGFKEFKVDSRRMVMKISKFT